MTSLQQLNKQEEATFKAFNKPSRLKKYKSDNRIAIRYKKGKELQGMVTVSNLASMGSGEWVRDKMITYFVTLTQNAVDQCNQDMKDKGFYHEVLIFDSMFFSDPI